MKEKGFMQNNLSIHIMFGDCSIILTQAFWNSHNDYFT